MESEKITSSSNANEQLLYFTSSSLSRDDSHLVFISDKTGNPNICVRNLATGLERQLTRNSEGFLKSYVYFDGTPYHGLGKASISLHAQSGTVYYIQGNEIRCVTLEGIDKTLGLIPEEQMTAFTHVSSDGRFLCVPTTDARALDGSAQLNGQPEWDIDKRVQDEKLSSYLRVFDTQTGRQIHCEKVESCWITHVQFSPSDSTRILYNHEWPSDCGIRRMWLWDGAQHIRLRSEGGRRSRADWTCHEMWERDGSAIIYHGAFANGPAYVGRMRWDGSDIREIPLPNEFTSYGHFTVGSPNVLVSDGYYEEPENAKQWGGSWISRVDLDWDACRAKWSPLCIHGSSWSSQDAHPHPIIDQAMRFVYFTSDKGGKRAIHRVALSGQSHLG